MSHFMKRFVFLLNLIFLPILSQAQPLPQIQIQSQTYVFISKPNGTPGINLEIPYDLGTHRASTTQAAGSLNASSDFQNVTGQFIVPISNIASGNATRDCHMREALGLDYSRSRFPKKHICNSDNLLPTSGDDAIAFPNIEFILISVQSDANITSQLQGVGNSFVVTAKGQWKIHGIQKDTSFRLNIVVLGNGVLNIKADPEFLLTDYNVVVKPVLGLNVKDKMTAHMDFLITKAN